MLTVEQFKARLLASSVDEVVRDIVLADAAAHVSDADRAYLASRLAETYGIAVATVQIWIVGSAKLGYSLAEKRLDDGTCLPRFRAFRADSDVDVTVISSPIFDAIWSDLSQHANHSTRMPWQSGQLGNYLVHGWLRPDKFPRARLRRCDDWWDLFRRFSRERRFGRRKVRGGLFYSFDDLVRYQSRGVAECRRALELNQ